MNNKELLKELANIVRSTHENLQFEANRTNSELLHSAAKTLDNLTAILHNASANVAALESSRNLECALKNEAYYFILEYGLLNEFKEYLIKTRKH